MKTINIKKLGIGILFALVAFATTIVVKNNVKVIQHECAANTEEQNEALFLSIFH